MAVRPLEGGDVADVVALVRARLTRESARNDVLTNAFDDAVFADTLARVREHAWVAESAGRVVGHLIGAVLDSPEYGRGAWWGPDGVSYDDPDTLADLYAAAARSWIDAGALEHYGWIFDDPEDLEPWHELGFARMHRRGVKSLSDLEDVAVPPGYLVRRGGPADIDLAVDLDRELDLAQREGPSFALVVEHASRRDDLLDALADAEVHHYVVDHAEGAVAQCLTFALDERRGSHPHSLHLSAVSVAPAHRGRGVATALVHRALRDAVSAGFAFAETNWRVTNRHADRFWRRRGFRPTYVRLHRTIGAG